MTAVRSSSFWVDIKAHLYFCVLNLHRVPETFKHPQCPFDLLAKVLHPIEAEQKLSKMRIQQNSEVFVFRRLYKNRFVLLSLCNLIHPIEQHSFPDASEAHEKKTLGCSRFSNASKCGLCASDNIAPPSQFRRGRPCAGSKRIFDRVHG